MKILIDKFGFYVVAGAILLMNGCSSVPEKQALCAEGTTSVDDICVEQVNANFIGCVNSQSLELGKEIKDSLSASVQYQGNGIEARKEVIEKLNKKYSASDDIKKIVIQMCGKLAGIVGGKGSIQNVSTKNVITKNKTSDPLEPIQTEYVGDYVFDLFSCNDIGRNVKCNFTVMKEGGGGAYFHRKSHKGASIIYFSNGEAKSAYKLNLGKAGGTKEMFGVRLPPGVPIKGTVEFQGVNTKSIKLLELGIAQTILSNPKYARFRDIVVSGG